MTYQKDCNCTGTSTMGGFQFDEKAPNVPATIQLVANYSDHPVCDVCGKAWKSIPDNRVHGRLTDIT